MGQHPFTEITVAVGLILGPIQNAGWASTSINGRDEPRESYTRIVDKGKMKSTIKGGVMVSVQIRGYVLPTHVWVVKEIDAV